MKREIILLPSLLLASGFETLCTQDIKFLNNYRKHFDRSRFDLEEIFIVTESDYELGGIMNPFNQMTVPGSIYDLCKKSIPAFPYATRQDIHELVYKDSFQRVLVSLYSEIVEEIKGLVDEDNTFINEAIENRKFSLQSLDAMKVHPFYQKIVALHLCGLGHVLFDSFNHLLSEYFTRY